MKHTHEEIPPQNKFVQNRSLPPIPTHKMFQKVIEPDLRPSKEFPYVLTPNDLEDSKNEYIVSLKNQGWAYTDINRSAHIDWNLGGRIIINHQTIKPYQVEEYAKRFPLIKDYTSYYTQKVTYFLDSSVCPNIEKMGFTIIHKNYSTNLEITETDVHCVTENNILMMLNLGANPGQGKLFSMPGRFQSVFELIHYPKPGLKLKTIKISNSALQNLILKKFERGDDEILGELITQAKKEEAMESLYEWYKEQAKFFLSDNFYRQFNPPLDCNAFVKDFLFEVKNFLEIYSEPKTKYRDFIFDIAEFIKSQSSKLDNRLTLVDDHHSEMVCSIRYQFFLALYAFIKKDKAVGAIPLPLPMVGLDVNAHLYIIIPREAVIFIAMFREYSNKLFNEVFNAKDEEGNFVAVFKNYSELKRFLVNCKMDASSAKRLAIDLHAQLCQEESWKKLWGARSDWQKLLDGLADMFNLVAPSKEVADELFKKSPEGRKILEDNWKNDLKKYPQDKNISGPLLSNGMCKPCLMEILKARINFHYDKCCISINLDKNGLTLNLKCSASVEMRKTLDQYSPVKYFDEGFAVTLTDHQKIRQFVDALKVNPEALYAEIKLDFNKQDCVEENCLQM